MYVQPDTLFLIYFNFHSNSLKQYSQQTQLKAGILAKKNLLLKYLSVVFNAHKIFDLSCVFVKLRTETVCVPAL